jgi:hypothetical protein
MLERSDDRRVRRGQRWVTWLNPTSARYFLLEHRGIPSWIHPLTPSPAIDLSQAYGVACGEPSRRACT